ncbi:MAG: hypothetical protein ACI97B_003806, partial [Verrucomicrobiales bacterium]
MTYFKHHLKPGSCALLLAMQLALASIGYAATDIVISEFLAMNDTSLIDEDGDFSDWIELYNASGSTVNLGGW